jgi:hypothetical protein
MSGYQSRIWTAIHDRWFGAPKGAEARKEWLLRIAGKSAKRRTPQEAAALRKAVDDSPELHFATAVIVRDKTHSEHATMLKRAFDECGIEGRQQTVIACRNLMLTGEHRVEDKTHGVAVTIRIA